MLKVPLDASPVHTDALLALVAMRPAAPGGGSSAAGGPGEGYLRTVHLDLSGQALATEQLRELLHEAPRRLKQCYMLESLVLSQCQLAPGALDALVHWKALKPLEGLRRLVLADNPLLGTQPIQQQQQEEAQQQGDIAAAAAAPAAPVFLGPQDLWLLDTRLFQAAPLQLLDIRRSGGWAAAGRKTQPTATAHRRSFNSNDSHVAACRPISFCCRLQ